MFSGRLFPLCYGRKETGRLIYMYVLFKTLSQTSPGFYVSLTFENTAGKGEIARNEQFLLFPQRFQLILRSFCHFNQL